MHLIQLLGCLQIHGRCLYISNLRSTLIECQINIVAPTFLSDWSHDHIISLIDHMIQSHDTHMTHRNGLWQSGEVDDLTLLSDNHPVHQQQAPVSSGSDVMLTSPFSVTSSTSGGMSVNNYNAYSFKNILSRVAECIA